MPWIAPLIAVIVPKEPRPELQAGIQLAQEPLQTIIRKLASTFSAKPLGDTGRSLVRHHVVNRPADPIECGTAAVHLVIPPAVPEATS